MTSANSSKIKSEEKRDNLDTAYLPTSHSTHASQKTSSTYKYPLAHEFSEKRLWTATYLPPTYLPHGAQELKAKEDEIKSVKMSRIQNFCFTLLLLALFTITIVSATTGNNDDTGPAPLSVGQQKFKDLLNSVEPSALHEVLHQQMKEKFQHGVFEEDKYALEALYQQNSELAESLVELVKRQVKTSSNGTGSSMVTSTTATTVETRTTAVISVTSGVTQSVATTSQAPTSQPTTLPTTPSTPQTSPQTTTVTTQTAPASSPSTLFTQSQVSTTTNTPVTDTPSSNAPSATTNSASSPSPTTEGSNGSSSSSSQSSVTQSVIYTTTLADGTQAIVTSVTVVPANQAASQTAGGRKPASTNTGNASLQTSGASSRQMGLTACVGVLSLVVAWAF